MSRITIKEASALTGIPAQTLRQQVQRGSGVGQLFKKDKHGHLRADENRVIAKAKEWNVKRSVATKPRR